VAVTGGDIVALCLDHGFRVRRRFEDYSVMRMKLE